LPFSEGDDVIDDNGDDDAVGAVADGIVFDAVPPPPRIIFCRAAAGD